MVEGDACEREVDEREMGRGGIMRAVDVKETALPRIGRACGEWSVGTSTVGGSGVGDEERAGWGEREVDSTTMKAVQTSTDDEGRVGDC